MERVRRIAFASMLIAGAVAPAVAQLPTPQSLDPVPLFKTFCTDGGGHLPGNAVSDQKYMTMPTAARTVMSLGAPNAEARASVLFSPLSRNDVPNRVFAIGNGGNEFLILAAPDKPGALATSCAVVWKGDKFDEARRAIFEITGMAPDEKVEDSGGNENIRAFGVEGKGFSLKAAQVDGWTLIRATPDGPIVARQKTVPAATSPIQPTGQTGVNERLGKHGETIVTAKP